MNEHFAVGAKAVLPLSKKSIAIGAAWIGVSRLVVASLGFLNTVILARMLTPEDFGLVAVATAVIAILTSMTELSLTSALIHHKDPTEDQFHAAWTLSLARACLLALLLSLLAYPVSRSYGDSRLIPILLVLSCSIVITGLRNPMLAMMQRQLVFWQEFVTSSSRALATILVSSGIAICFRSYWALIAGAVVANLVDVVASYLIQPFRPKFRIKGSRSLWSFSLWLSLGQAVSTLNWRFDQIIIGYFLGKSTLGGYVLGSDLAATPTREATNPLAGTLFPAFVRLRDDKAALQRAYLSAQSMLCGIAFPAGFGFALIADQFVPLVLGDAWAGATIVIQLLGGAIALHTLSATVQPLGLALGQTRRLFHRDVAVLIVRLPVIVAGLWVGGLLGLLVARVAVTLGGVVYNMVLVRELIGTSVSRQFLVNLRTALSTCMIIIVGLLTNWAFITLFGHESHVYARLTAVVLVSALAYVGAAFGFWRVAGSPAGPEREILRILGVIANRFGKLGRSSMITAQSGE
ncbi:lipopolysaccharide biosynthesis protein [Bradyrhizobium sp. Ec3.3]|uniref:lipopolysaccharide biosynthesis protein n=1 Tax=Bradyrhizobium sp. Ec3.3 TaxID=189753 RepID=UPI000411B580|nr:lipopolysaccharide biosynthesis protein [Bradyrhizobium sp. Ec3.3]